jgi:hypothetical protein
MAIETSSRAASFTGPISALCSLKPMASREATSILSPSSGSAPKAAQLGAERVRQRVGERGQQHA